MDDTDKFLRKYILTKGWIDRDDFAENSEEEDDNNDNDDELHPGL
jgi:protein KRI1